MSGDRSAWPRTLLSILAGGFVVAVLLKIFVAEPYQVSSISMQPGLEVGDRVLVDKLSYLTGEVARGDVVVFDGTNSFSGSTGPEGLISRLLTDIGLREDPNTFVKRVIAIGGDRVTCCTTKGRLTVNGTEIAEPYIYAGESPSNIAFDVIVPKGHLWVMGDHRRESADSRALMGRPGGGFVPATRVKGKARWLVWPPSRIGSVPGTHAFAEVTTR